MPGKIYNWIKIAGNIDEIDFASNNIAITVVEGKKICLGKHKGNVFAFAHKCPHAGGTLADGFINGWGNIVCPVHNYVFNMQNGLNVSGEGYYLKHWPIETRDEGLFIGM